MPKYTRENRAIHVTKPVFSLRSSLNKIMERQKQDLLGVELNDSSTIDVDQHSLKEIGIVVYEITNCACKITNFNKGN